jgi:hypothetical protein
MAGQVKCDPHPTYILIMQQIMTIGLRKWRACRPRILNIFTYKRKTKD